MERRNKLNTLKIALILSAFLHLGLFLVLKPFHKALSLRETVSISLIEKQPLPSPPLPTPSETLKPEPREEKPKEPKSETLVKVQKETETKTLKPKTEAKEKVEKALKTETKMDLEKLYREKIKQMEERVKKAEALSEQLEKKRQETIKRIEEKFQEELTSNETPGEKVSLDIYFHQLQQHVRRFWVIPEGFNPEGLKTVIKVKIDPEGRVLLAQIEQGSGNRIFDNSALQAVKRAEPYPPPPEKKTLEVGLVFKP